MPFVRVGNAQERQIASVCAIVVRMVMLRFPAPDNDNDFDWLVAEIAERKYKGSATRYGRNGQGQYGVDITLHGPQRELIAIQSKHTSLLTDAMMDKEIDKLLGLSGKPKFPHAVDEFIFATSASRDTKQSDHALALAQLYPSIRVTVWPWERINELLNTMPELAAQYTAAILTPFSLEDVKKRHVNLLRRALDRPALLDGFELEFNFSHQAAALRDIAGFISTGNLYDRSGILVDSVVPYDGDDVYARALARLRKAILSLAQYIETNLSELQNYTFSAGVRRLDATNVKSAKTYIDFEAKRIAILRKANVVLMEEGLAPLPS